MAVLERRHCIPTWAIFITKPKFTKAILRNALNHRFGVIPAAVSTATVPPGRELLCHYNVEYHDGAPWFQVRLHCTDYQKVPQRKNKK